MNYFSLLSRKDQCYMLETKAILAKQQQCKKSIPAENMEPFQAKESLVAPQVLCKLGKKAAQGVREVGNGNW